MSVTPVAGTASALFWSFRPCLWSNTSYVGLGVSDLTTLVDVCCGTGSIGLCLANWFGQVKFKLILTNDILSVYFLSIYLATISSYLPFSISKIYEVIYNAGRVPIYLSI